jgi:phenylacetic acid degradation operon negative regulatory protein
VKPTAKRIVLELLSAADDHAASAASLVASAKLLGVAENSLRVTLTRLLAAGTLELESRGVYRLGAATQAMTRQVTGWREVERHVRRWDGGWACVQAGTVDRAGARRRDRALRLLGFRALAGALHVRPDNLDPIVQLRARLYELGVEPNALVFRATDFDDDTEARARALWNRDRLTASYVATRERIDRWLVAVAELPLRTAAREAFFFGGDVLRMILFDPRLPEPLVDVAARRALVEAAIRLDTAGRRLWTQLVGMQHGLVVTPENVRWGRRDHRHVQFS